MEKLSVIQSSEFGLDIFHSDESNTSGFMHIHNHYEIYFSLSDGHKFFVGKKIFSCNKNDVFLFDSTDLHKIAVSEGISRERMVISFAPDLVKRFLSDGETLLKCFNKRQVNHSYKLSLFGASSERLFLLMKNMSETFYSQNTYKKEKLLVQLLDILILINEEADIRNVSERDMLSKSSDAKIVKDVLYFINQNFTRPLLLEDIADTFFCNKYYLCRIFRAETGFSVGDYIQSCRIAHAVTLLQSGSNVSETALHCGFGSDTYFISTFKKSMGITPKKYAMSFCKRKQ